MSVELRLAELDGLPREEAVLRLQACCGSNRWARSMAESRPFSSVERLHELALRHWRELDREDWLEAFAAHPRIGERAHGAGASARWSEGEQSGTEEADAAVLERLAAVNRAYEERFGFVFLICATGKTAEEMLATAERRLENDPETELAEAAREQSAITRLRLEKLLR